jgi:hypothetical protein
MTNEKLIALSDLNREDNIKYISSEAQGIAITLDSDRYAPTLCKLERAYICGRRKSEEQIKEIENYFVESAGYGRDKVRNFMDIVNKALKQKGERITELEKENARLATNEKSLLAERKIIAKENTEAKNLIEELASSLSVVGECDEEECELIDKAQKFINKPIF